MDKVPYGLAVRIPGFHPGGPGSTPGMGIRSITCVAPFMCCGDHLTVSVALYTLYTIYKNILGYGLMRSSLLSFISTASPPSSDRRWADHPADQVCDTRGRQRWNRLLHWLQIDSD